MPGLAFEDAIATSATGDLWLFRGRSLADRAIQTVTNAPVNHVGMVVALDDLPPLLWHAELGRSLPDVWTGERQRGVQLHVLADAVRTWGQRYGQRAWLRQLEGTLEREHEDRLMQVIERFDGRSFPTSVGLARQWLTGRFRRRESSLETIYCAELVATTYQHMGLLPEPPAGELVRPGPLLERRPDRARAAVRALGRDRRRLSAAHAGRPGADRDHMSALRSAPVAIRLVLAALTLLLAVYAAEIVFAVPARRRRRPVHEVRVEPHLPGLPRRSAPRAASAARASAARGC